MGQPIQQRLFRKIDRKYLLQEWAELKFQTPIDIDGPWASGHLRYTLLFGHGLAKKYISLFSFSLSVFI